MLSPGLQCGFGIECLARMEHRLGLDGRPWKLVLRIQGECCYVPPPSRVAVHWTGGDFEMKPLVLEYLSKATSPESLLSRYMNLWDKVHTRVLSD